MILSKSRYGKFEQKKTILELDKLFANKQTGGTPQLLFFLINVEKNVNK